MKLHHLDGKSKIIQKDRTETKSSYRSLPLVPPFEELLHRLKAQQELNQKLCGRSYCKIYTGYIYVNEIGELVKPGYLTQHFPLILQKNGMRKIRFHDLRHSCASLFVVRKRCKPERNSGVVGSQRHFDHLKHLHALEFHFKGCVCQCDFGRISLRLMCYVPPMSLRKSARKRQIC